MFEDETQRLLSNSLRHQRQSFLVLRQSECSDFEYELNWQVVHGQRGFNLFLAHCKAEVLIGSRHFPIHPVLCHGRHSHQEPSTSSPKNRRIKMLLRLAGAFRNASSASSSRVLHGVRSGPVAHFLIHFWDNSQQHRPMFRSVLPRQRAQRQAQWM